VLVPKGAYLVIVEETEHRNKYPHLATLQKSVAFWDGLKARGYKYGWYDVNLPEIKPYMAAVDKVGPPALLAIMPDGTIPLAVPCPPSTDTINQYLEP
jgi:hypothetical protein